MAGRKKSKWAERMERAAREPPVETRHLVGFGVIAVIFTLLYLPLMNIMAKDYRGRHALQTRGLDATAQVRAMWITTGGRRSPDTHNARIAFLARGRGEVIQDVTVERDDVDRVDDDADVPVLYDPADPLNVRINLDNSIRKEHPLLVTILFQIMVTLFVLMLWTAWIIVFRNWLRARREGRS